MTHACESIALPQTSFAGGKYGLVSRSLKYRNNFIGFITQSLGCTGTRVDLMPQHGHRYKISLDNITARNEREGNVFAPSVIWFTGGGMRGGGACVHGRRDGHCSERYASYWNAFS